MLRFYMCPTGDDDDSMQVVGHDDECIYPRMSEMLGDSLEATLRDLAARTESHPLINDLTQKTALPLRADGDEICPGPSVVVPFQANGARVANTHVVIQ